MITIDNLYYFYSHPNEVNSEYYYIINGIPYYAHNLQRIDRPLNEIFVENNHFDPFVINSDGSEILLVSTVNLDIPYQQLANGRFIELTGRTPIHDSLLIDVTILKVPLPGGQEVNGVFQNLPLNPVDDLILDRILDSYEGQELNNSLYDDISELINEPPFPAYDFVEEPTLDELQELAGLYRQRITGARGSVRLLLETNLLDLQTYINESRSHSNIYVHNVNSRTNISDVINLFQNIRTIRFENGVYVITFLNEHEANNALNLNGVLLDGNIIRVTQEETQTVIQDDLTKESHAMYMSQVYGLSVIVPDFLIVNGLKINFISFQEVVEMLSQNQIERYILDPVLQPWAGLPSSQNRIITMFNNNGMTYLIKAKYDRVSNQIFQPV
jgi:hypothetical protein